MVEGLREASYIFAVLFIHLDLSFLVFRNQHPHTTHRWLALKEIDILFMLLQGNTWGTLINEWALAFHCKRIHLSLGNIYIIAMHHVQIRIGFIGSNAQFGKAIWVVFIDDAIAGSTIVIMIIGISRIFGCFGYLMSCSTRE